MIRAGVGWQQLQSRTGGPPGILRQLALWAAIVVLLLFEILSNLLQVAAGVPPQSWFLAAGLYVAYAALIFAALTGRRNPSGAAPR